MGDSSIMGDRFAVEASVAEGGMGRVGRGPDGEFRDFVLEDTPLAPSPRGR